MFRQRNLDPAMAGDGPPRAGFAVRLPQPHPGQLPRHGEDGSVHLVWARSSSHGDHGHPG